MCFLSFNDHLFQSMTTFLQLPSSLKSYLILYLRILYAYMHLYIILKFLAFTVMTSALFTLQSLAEHRQEGLVTPWTVHYSRSLTAVRMALHTVILNLLLFFIRILGNMDSWISSGALGGLCAPQPKSPSSFKWYYYSYSWYYYDLVPITHIFLHSHWT